MVFAKTTAHINVDVLYYKMDHNNRKIFYPHLFADIPRQTDRWHLARFDVQRFKGFAPGRPGLNHKIPFFRMRNGGFILRLF